MIRILWKLMESDETQAFKDIHQMLANLEISQAEFAEVVPF